jgi:hypothetical protein
LYPPQGNVRRSKDAASSWRLRPAKFAPRQALLVGGAKLNHWGAYILTSASREIRKI